MRLAPGRPRRAAHRAPRRWSPANGPPGRRADMSSQADDAGPPGERRWLVLYDGECSLCMWLLALLLRLDGERRLRPAALQGAEAERLLADLAPAERMTSWHLISPQGRRDSAGAALPSVMRLLRFGRLPADVLSRLPGPTERGYR